jgi:hypothetical protein
LQRNIPGQANEARSGSGIIGLPCHALSPKKRNQAMHYLLLVYTDPALLQELPAEEYDRLMRGCLQHADALKEQGRLVASQQLEPAASARAVRIRNGRTSVLDGPFAETKEVLAGFNLVQADSHDEAVRMAEDLPWARFGCIEVRPVADMSSVRRRVGA